MPERQTGFLWRSVAHSKVSRGIPAQLTQEEQPQHCAKHQSCHELPNPAGIRMNLLFQDSLIF